MEFKHIRIKLGYTQKKMATFLGINQATVSKMENGGTVSLSIRNDLVKKIDWLSHDDFITKKDPTAPTIEQLLEDKRKMQLHIDTLMALLAKKIE